MNIKRPIPSVPKLVSELTSELTLELRPMHGTLLAVFCLIFVFTSCATSLGDMAGRPRTLTEPLGICHAGKKGDWEHTLLSSVGAAWTRQDVDWETVEPRPGEFDFSDFDSRLAAAEAAGLKMLAILDYDTPWIHESPDGKVLISEDQLPHWLNFVEQVVTRYGSRVAAYEIWNEPNFPVFWTGTDEEFFTLTRETVRLIKRLRPDMPVAAGSIMYHPVMGGPSFLDRLLESGAADLADVISIHTYGLSPTILGERAGDALKKIRAAGFEGSLWVTETGVPTGGFYPHAVAPGKQGSFMVKTLITSWAAGADKVFIYTMFDSHPLGEAPGGTSSEGFFGLYGKNGTAKTGALALERLAPVLSGASRFSPDRLDTSSGTVGLAEMYVFETADGRVLLAAWSVFGRPLVLPRGFSRIDSIYRTADSAELPAGDTEFHLGPEPVIILGEASGGVGLIHTRGSD